MFSVSATAKVEEEEEAESPVISAEVLALVFPHLDTLSLCQAALVSKEWRDVGRNPDVWQHVTIKNAQISSKVSCHIAKNDVISLRVSRHRQG